MTRTALFVVTTTSLLAAFPANAQQSPNPPDAQQFREVDREYDEAEHVCKRLLVGHPDIFGWAKKRCIETRLGMRAPEQHHEIDGNINIQRR